MSHQWVQLFEGLRGRRKLREREVKDNYKIATSQRKHGAKN
jgi:hypothetical protein